MKDDLGAPPDAAACVSAEVGEDANVDDDEGSIPNGTYTTTITREEALTTCPDLVPDEFPGEESTYELTLDDGDVTLLHQSGGERDITLTGTYTVFRDLFTLEAEPDKVSAQWAIDGSALTFTNMEAPFCGYEVVWTTHPWVLVGTATSSRSTWRA